MGNRLLFTGFAFLLFGACQRKAEGTWPQKMDITESVYASVTVQPDSLYQVYANVTGILQTNLVEEGERVRKGQPLLKIASDLQKINHESARSDLELAQEHFYGNSSSLNELEREINLAKLVLRDDSLNLKRQQRLWEQNIGSKADLERRTLAFEQARSKLELLKTQYYRIENELNNRLDLARNKVRTSRVAYEDFTIASQINGKVYALNKEPGERVGPQEALALVGKPNGFLITLLVDEIDIVKIELDQRVLITLDAYGTQVFEAVISKIYPTKDERSQTFEVEAIFEKIPEKLYPGLAGEGNIVTAKRENVLTIPLAYVFDTNKVRTEAGIKEVVFGVRNLERVEIVAGLDEQSKILSPKE